jgi:hypothetical protein
LALLRSAKDLDGYAFALGALAHYAADNNGHRIGTNPAVPILYPKLKKKYGYGYSVFGASFPLLEEAFRKRTAWASKGGSNTHCLELEERKTSHEGPAWHDAVRRSPSSRTFWNLAKLLASVADSEHRRRQPACSASKTACALQGYLRSPDGRHLAIADHTMDRNL